MSRSLSVALVCVMLVGTVFGGGLAVATDQTRATPDAGNGDGGREPARVGAAAPPLSISTQGEFARSTFEIEVFRNGSARWTFLFVRPLANDSERDAFQTFADRFESEDTDFYRTYRERARALTDTASDTTGREMTARNFSRSARIAPAGNRGIVEVSFVWTNLGVVDGDQVTVADVFDGGFYIADDQWLVFEAGPEMAFDTERTDPAPDEFSGDTLAGSDTLTWIGERQFTDNHPRVVLAPNDGIGGGTDTGGPTTAGAGTDGATTAGGDGGDGSGGSIPLVVLGLVLLVGLGAGAAWRTGAIGSRTSDTGSGGAAGASSDADSAAAGASAASTASADTDASSEPAVPDEELLTDEDRVLQMLEDSGGRMKQANIVDETGWSKSKVSMLLSDMEDEGDISKLRVGRENIVSLKGQEPDAAGSPFDDDS